MIRTVIQQKGSFTITIPKKWATRHHIEDKTPLEIVEDEFSNKLLIAPPHTTSERPEKTVNVKHMDYRDVLNVVNQNYRLGYDIIRLIDVKEGIKEEVEDIATKLIGFSSSTRKNNITFEMLNTDQYDTKQINNLLRKLFFIIEETFNEDFDELKGLKHDMDTHTNYLRRMIAKHDHGGKSSYQYYTLTNNLSLAQHAIYRSRIYSKDKNIKELLKQSHDMFQYLEKGFFEEDLDTLAEVDDKKKDMYKEIDKHILTHPEPYVKFFYEQVRMIHMTMPSAKGIILSK